MLNLADVLDSTAARLPANIAVSDGERALTYAQLWQEVCLAAERLKVAGVCRDQMVGLQLGNSIAYIVLTYALWRCGAVVVPIPLEMRDIERSELLCTMDLAAVVSGKVPSCADTDEGIDVAGTPVRVVALHERIAPVRSKVNAALVRFTSGTTNVNKGVVLSHECILERITAASAALHIGPGDSVIWCLPMVHHFVVTIIQYLWRGATIVLVRNTACEQFLDTIVENRGTVLYASPFHYDALSKDGSGRAIPSVRMAISTTTALSPETALRFHERYGLRLIQAYGIIEVGLACVNLDDPAGRPTSAGRPAPGFRLRLVNESKYAGSGDGCGEIEVTGPGLFVAYFHPWMAAGEVMDGSWFHTGDVGRIDGGGFLFLQSRANSVINIAGMKVFPEEIECALNEHSSVQEARAYAVKHAHLGEVVGADVVLRRGAAPATVEDLRMHCATCLSSFKVPNGIRFVDAIEKTLTTLKIKRPGARESLS